MRPEPLPILCLLSIALAAPLRAGVGPWVANDQARVRLVSALASAPAGSDAGLGIEFTLAPGWHVYWKNAGDAGYAPEIALPEQSPLESALLRFPAPHRYELPGDLVAFGYEDEVIYPIDARLRDDLGPGPAELRLELDYLVCAERCIPYVAELALPLEIGAPARDEPTAARIATWRDRLPVPAGTADAPGAETRLELVSKQGGMELVVELGGEGASVASPDLFFEPHSQISFGPPRFVATTTGPAFRVPVAPLDRTRPLPDPLPVAWTATGLVSATGAALAIEDRVEVALPEAPGSGIPSALRRAAVVALGVLIVLLLLRRFGGRRPQPSTTHSRSLTMSKRCVSLPLLALSLALIACSGPSLAEIAVGDPAPEFTLTDLDGESYTLSELRGKTVVLEWINPNCPFSRAHSEQKTMQSTAEKHSGVVWLAINSTRPSHGDHLTPAEHKAFMAKNGATYPVLEDPSGDVGRAYGARTTPHMYVIDVEGQLAYMGAIDDGPSNAETNYVDAALSAIASGAKPDPASTRPYGCSVKY